MLDVLRSDAFGMVSLTTALDKLPYAPGRLGSLGIFTVKGIAETTVTIEERFGRLSLIPAQARGVIPTAQRSLGRKVRQFPVGWLPEVDTVIADEVQNIRAFGTEDTLEGVAGAINDKMARLKQNLEVTKEFYRASAIAGKTLDADGSTTLFDWFSEFGISETVIDVDMNDTVGDDIETTCLEIIRELETALGAQSYGKIRAICGNNFFDHLITSKIRDAYKTWQTGLGSIDAVFSIQSPQVKREGFPFGGIIWENYRGTIGSVDFVDEDSARIVVDGVPDLFLECYGPPPFKETVNTTGRPWYAKTKDQDWDMGTELLVCCCPLIFCTRPACLIKLNDNTTPDS